LGEVTDINRGTFANVYSSTNVRNTTVWTNKISPVDITCVSTHQTGGVLISPRHTLHCAHLGWYPKANDVMNFVKSDNTVVSATVLSSTTIEGFSNETGHPYDMALTYLDINVESSGIPVCKVLPDDYQTYISPIVYDSFADFSTRTAVSGKYSVPAMCLQNNEDVLSVGNLVALIKVPAQNSNQVSPGYTVLNSNSTLRTKFTYSVDGGDSGSPTFLVIDNQLVLVGTITQSGYGHAGTAIIEEVKTRVESRMNSLAAAQNDNTSYSLTPIDLSDADLSTIFYRNESNELDPELFRQWLNSNVSFAKYDGSLSDPAQTLGIYWYTDTIDPTTIYARLFPDYSNKVADYGLIIEDAESTFNGKYNWNLNSNRWILSTNPNVQMRCSNNNWILGVLDGATYTTYYSLISVSSEYSLLPTTNGSTSDAFQEVYNSSVYTCQSIPLGTWSSDGYIGANFLITSQLGEIYQ